MVCNCIWLKGCHFSTPRFTHTHTHTHAHTCTHTHTHTHKHTHTHTHLPCRCLRMTHIIFSAIFEHIQIGIQCNVLMCTQTHTHTQSHTHTHRIFQHVLYYATNCRAISANIRLSCVSCSMCSVSRDNT